MSRLSLKQAAEFAGVTKPTVLKHIKAGKVSADKDPEGRWWFDVTELVRVYGEPETGHDSITGSRNALINIRNPRLLQQETAAQQLLLNELRRQLGEMKEERQRERDELMALGLASSERTSHSQCDMNHLPLRDMFGYPAQVWTVGEGRGSPATRIRPGLTTLPPATD
jgi:hypothetical protein